MPFEFFVERENILYKYNGLMNDSVMQIEVKHVVRSMSRLILKILGTLI